MEQKSFGASTRTEAKQLAAAWVSSQRDIDVKDTNIIGIHTGSDKSPEKLVPRHWIVVVDYEKVP
jgi:hypothetical protein